MAVEEKYLESVMERIRKARANNDKDLLEDALVVFATLWDKNSITYSFYNGMGLYNEFKKFAEEYYSNNPFDLDDRVERVIKVLPNDSVTKVVEQARFSRDEKLLMHWIWRFERQGQYNAMIPLAGMNDEVFKYVQESILNQKKDLEPILGLMSRYPEKVDFSRMRQIARERVNCVSKSMKSREEFEDIRELGLEIVGMAGEIEREHERIAKYNSRRGPIRSPER